MYNAFALLGSGSGSGSSSSSSSSSSYSYSGDGGGKGKGKDKGKDKGKEEANMADADDGLTVEQRVRDLHPDAIIVEGTELDEEDDSGFQVVKKKVKKKKKVVWCTYCKRKGSHSLRDHSRCERITELGSALRTVAALESYVDAVPDGQLPEDVFGGPKTAMYMLHRFAHRQVEGATMCDVIAKFTGADNAESLYGAWYKEVTGKDEPVFAAASADGSLEVAEEAEEAGSESGAESEDPAARLVARVTRSNIELPEIPSERAAAHEAAKTQLGKVMTEILAPETVVDDLVFGVVLNNIQEHFYEGDAVTKYFGKTEDSETGRRVTVNRADDIENAVLRSYFEDQDALFGQLADAGIDVHVLKHNLQTLKRWRFLYVTQDISVLGSQGDSADPAVQALHASVLVRLNSLVEEYDAAIAVPSPVPEGTVVHIAVNRRHETRAKERFTDRLISFNDWVVNVSNGDLDALAALFEKHISVLTPSTIKNFPAVFSVLNEWINTPVASGEDTTTPFIQRKLARIAKLKAAWPAILDLPTILADEDGRLNAIKPASHPEYGITFAVQPDQ